MTKTLTRYENCKIRVKPDWDFDVAKWTIQSRPIDALLINEQWIYGIAQVDGTAVAKADGTTNSFKLTKTWLLHAETSGEWLIKRQMWNLY
jgi:hypothetical protein